MVIDKQSFRANMLSVRRECSEVQRKTIDQQITNHILVHPAYIQANIIFIYYSIGDEISTMELIDDALQCGKIVCIPHCEPNRQMSARAITQPGDLTESSFGIPEPGMHCPSIAPEQLELCIIPSLACDRQGYRLGYGGGYYDRFLLKTAAKKMALCASNRFFKQIPHETHDIPCDMIITENEVYTP